MVQFRTIVELRGTTATGAVVPEETVLSLGAGKRPAVRISIGEYTFRSRVGIMGGEYLIPISAETRAAAGVNAGDEIDIILEVDEAPRVIEVPADFAAELAADAEAGAFFETLSYSNKRRLVMAIDDAKTPETRARRIARTLDQLRSKSV